MSGEGVEGGAEAGAAAGAEEGFCATGLDGEGAGVDGAIAADVLVVTGLETIEVGC